MRYLIFAFLLALPLGRADQPTSFTDTDLAQLLLETSKSKQPLLIYAWSPHMPLSWRGLDELLVEAELKDVRVVPLLDPFGNQLYAQAIAQKHGWPITYVRKINSANLVKTGLRTHYPAYVFKRWDRVEFKTVPGYKAPLRLKQLVQKELR